MDKENFVIIFFISIAILAGMYMLHLYSTNFERSCIDVGGDIIGGYCVINGTAYSQVYYKDDKIVFISHKTGEVYYGGDKG